MTDNITISRAVVQAALDALIHNGITRSVVEDLRKALAQPAKEPRKPLTDEKIEDISRQIERSDFFDCVVPFARAVEAAHGITD